MCSMRKQERLCALPARFLSRMWNYVCSSQHLPSPLSPVRIKSLRNEKTNSDVPRVGLSIECRYTLSIPFYIMLKKKKVFLSPKLENSITKTGKSFNTSSKQLLSTRNWDFPFTWICFVSRSGGSCRIW